MKMKNDDKQPRPLLGKRSITLNRMQVVMKYNILSHSSFSLLDIYAFLMKKVMLVGKIVFNEPLIELANL